MRAEGQLVSRATVATMSPYQQDNVRRFGDFVYDLDTPTETMDAHLELDEEVEDP